MVTAVKGSKGRSPAPSDIVDVVVMLRAPAGGRVPTPAQSTRAVKSALAQARAVTGLEPNATTIFEQLNSFSLRAAKSFVDALAHSDSVAEVLPNEQSGSALIKPVKRVPVKLSGSVG